MLCGGTFTWRTGGPAAVAGDELVLVVVAVLAVLNIVGLTAVYAMRYKRVRPNQAMVVYGRRFGTKGFMVYTSGGKFIVPILESFMFLSLEPFPIDLRLEDVSLRSGTTGARFVRVRAAGTARISPDPKALERAASSISGKSPDQIRALTDGVLEDHLRRTFGDSAFAPSYPGAVDLIRAGAQKDLDEFGIRLVSFSMTLGPGPAD